MKITNFEITPSYELNTSFNYFEDIDKDKAREYLKIYNISFILEDITRLQSMLICELKDSYVQQSQRYTRIDNTGYTLPTVLSPEDKNKAIELTELLFSLYKRMSIRKSSDKKGRPVADDYVHGIPIEDARYILPLTVNTNVSVAMSGDKLIDLFALRQPRKYYAVLNKICHDLYILLPANIQKILCNIKYSTQDLEYPYERYYNLLSDKDNVLLFHHFQNADVKVGLGALTSSSSKSPSEVYEDYISNNKSDKFKEVIKRVLGYGHTAIAEQFRTTTGLMCSLTTYHQLIRHRINSSQREDFDYLVASERPVKIPPSIQGTEFEKEFLDLVEKVRQFRLDILKRYGKLTAANFLLNCEQIKVVQSSNARADVQMLRERLCMTAQWEIRELAMKKFMLLRNLSDVLFEAAIPPCVHGKCKEGKMTCGKAEEVKQMFSK